MTDQELAVLNKTAEAWNLFTELPVMHSDDVNDFRFHLHALQNIIYSREGLRAVNYNMHVPGSFQTDTIKNDKAANK